MQKYNISDYKGGWFIGGFDPTIYSTLKFECAVKYYKAGDKDKKHYHRYATEYTVIVTGRVRMNDQEFKTGDIVVIPPCESVAFEAIDDSITTVVKVPCVLGDKFEDFD